MNTTAIGPQLEGRTIDGRFVLQRWLGGSQGSGVYRTELEAAWPAAIKLIAADTAAAETRATGWAAAVNLSHLHIVRAFNSGRCALDDCEVFYVVTELADEVLSEILPQRPLTPEETREMLEPVLDALAYLHGKGFAHGRLKPSNILVVEDKLKLSADCIALAAGAGRQLPEQTIYDAPELSSGEISPAADVWSLGMTLVAALTQQAPVWERSSGAEPVVPDTVSEPFAQIARGCLRLNPAQRLTLGEITARLKSEDASPENALSEKRPPETAAPTQAEEPEVRTPLIGRPALLIAAAIVLVVIVAAMLLHTRHTPSRTKDAERSPAPAASAATPIQPQASAAQAAAPVPAPAAALKPSASTAMQPAEQSDIANRVLPDVPAKALHTIHGKVAILVRVQVDTSGNVSDAASESPGASKYFTRLALDAARQWKFAPSQSGVGGERTLRFLFRPDGVEATAYKGPQ